MRKWGWAATAAGAGAAVAGVMTARWRAGSREARQAIAGRHIVRKAITLAAEPERVFDMWRDASTHSRIRDFEVTAVGDNRWHWRRELPGGRHAEWDTVFTHEQRPERLEWRSENGGPRWGVFHQGVLHLRPAHNGQETELRLSLELSLAQNLLWVRPRIEYGVERALRRFRQLVETGELSTVAGQPAYGQEGGRMGKAA